jgi:hypothetical protein
MRGLYCWICHARTVLLDLLDKAVLLYLLFKDCPAGFNVAGLSFLICYKNFLLHLLASTGPASLICYESIILLDLLEQDLPAWFTMTGLPLLDLLWQDCTA